MSIHHNRAGHEAGTTRRATSDWVQSWSCDALRSGSILFENRALIGNSFAATCRCTLTILKHLIVVRVGPGKRVKSSVSRMFQLRASIMHSTSSRLSRFTKSLFADYLLTQYRGGNSKRRVDFLLFRKEARNPWDSQGNDLKIRDEPLRIIGLTLISEFSRWDSVYLPGMISLGVIGTQQKYLEDGIFPFFDLFSSKKFEKIDY